MKWKTLLFLCFISKLAMAQLSVNNSSFIYVNTTEDISDVYVYVEDDVNLEDTNSHIYLRKDGQLLQGNGTIGNSGVGQLSVNQNGTVHNYAYNYWCSPVGNTNIDDFGNRAFTPSYNVYDHVGDVDPDLDPITSSLATYTTDYDGTSAPLVVSNRWLYVYSPGTVYSDWDYIGSGGSVTTGYGFTMKGTSGSGNNQLYDFRGKPNNGTITTNVLDGEWTLVGNPYPSAIDALEFIHDTQNQTSINGSLYYWEQDLSVSSHNVADHVGGYASYTITSDGVTETFTPATFDTYNGDGSFNTTGSASASGKAARRYIPIGQGFMVEGIANSTVRTLNDHRVYYRVNTAQSEFFEAVVSTEEKQERKTQNKGTSNYVIEYDENGLQILPNEYQRFRLNIDFNDTYTRQVLQNFHGSATDSFDYGLEIKSPEGVDSDAHWILNGVPYVAQAFRFNENLKIPLVINTKAQQLIRFRIYDIQNFDANQTIYLHDLVTDAYIDLSQQNYEVDLEAGNYSNRFEVTFVKETLDISESDLDQFTIFQNNATSQLTLANPNNLKINHVSLFDASGKQVFHHIDLSLKTKHEFSTQNLSDGVYLVTVKTGNTSINKKVVVSNK